MIIGDTVLWKGKPAKIFGTASEGMELRHFYIMMLNGRKHPGIYHVSVKSKHLQPFQGEDHEEIGNSKTC